MTSDPRRCAVAVAAALLDGEWEAAGLTARGAAAIGVTTRRLTPTVNAVLAAYREPPLDRRRELARFVAELPAFDRLWRRGRTPRVLVHALPRSAMARTRWAVPRFDTVSDLADWAELDTPHLDWYADVRSLERTASPALRHYDRTWVYRSNGRIRLLEAPRPRLKALQRQILREILDIVPTHDAAHGFVAGRSVMTFAAPHVDRDVVIRLDLDGFFASITAGRVFGVLRAVGYPEAVAHYLTGLATTVVPRADLRVAPQPLRDPDIGPRRRVLDRLARPHLPQGAPTSPAIANLVARRLDARLTGLAAASDAAYTRYADDLALSLAGPDACRRARRLTDVMRRTVVEEGFRVNDAKTRLSSRSSRQQLCGVVVNERPGVGRRERDRLRAILHNCRTHGPESQNHAEHADYQAHLLGRVAWVTAINPVHGAQLRAAFDEIEW